MIFFSKTISFLCNQMAQTVVVAPNSTIFLSSLLKPPSQFSNILEILDGFRMPMARYIKPQTMHARRHSKNRCLIISITGQMQHVLFSYQLRFTKLYLIKMTPLLKCHRKTFSFSGAFNFHMRLFKFGTTPLIKF